MFEFLKRKSAPEPQPQIRIITRDRSDLTMEQWRGEPALVGKAISIIGSDDFMLMMDLLEREHPGNSVLSLDTPDYQRAIWQARCEGYTMALANLRALAIFRKPVEPLEATFEKPETDQI